MNQKREYQTILNEILTGRCRTIRKIRVSVSLFEGLSLTNFLIVVENFQNLRMHIEEKCIPTFWAGLHAWVTCGNLLFHFGGILLKQSEISPRWTGSLLIWTHCFWYSFLKKVRSHLGEPTHKMGSAHLHVNSLLIASKFLLFI